MKFAIVGGSFNPVHKGHLKLAAETLNLGYDRVILVPAAQSPFKPDGQASSAALRAEMLFAAIAGERRLTCDLCEVRREGVSYTVDTLRDIIERYTPEGKPALVLGDDLVGDFAQWRGADEIAANAEIIIARRECGGAVFPFPHRAMRNDVVALSSAQIRNAAAAGENWRDYVSAPVAAIIQRGNLYADAASGAEQSPETRVDALPAPAPLPAGTAALEDFVRTALNLERFSHSRNVALHCADLAPRFGLDAEAAWRAGLLHDICKGLSSEDMMELAARDSEPFSAEERAKPALLHGRAAAVWLRESGERDAALLEAVRRHTTGADGIGPLAKIVYLTDKIEVGRTTVDAALRRLAFGPAPCRNLDELYTTVHAATQAWLKERGII